MARAGWRRAVLFAGIVSSVSGSHAQAQLVRFTRFGLEDGLSQASGYALAQDMDGFLWVGTQNGLNRFDGRAFRSSWMDGSEQSPVSYALVQSLFSDSRGRLWAGLDDRGLHLFDRLREEFHAVQTLSPDGSPRSPPSRFWAFAEIGSEVFVSTDQGLGTLVTDSAGVALRLLGERTSGCARSLTAMWAASDTLWLGTQDGCVVLDQPRAESRAEVIARLGVAVTDIVGGTGTTVLVGTDGRGVFEFDRRGRQRASRETEGVTSPTDQVRTILTTSTGDTWIGTNGGLGWIQPGSADTTWYTLGSEAAGALPHQRIDALHEDRSGVLWIGTWNGLARLSPFYRGIRFIPVSSTEGEEGVGGVISILPNGPRHLLTGSLDAVLADVPRFEQTGAVVVKGDPEMSEIRSMAWGANGDLWVATIYSGIHRRTTAGWRTYRAGRMGPGSAPSDEVSSILVDRSGTVWAGAHTRGLWVYDREADRFRSVDVSGPSYGLAGAYVWPIREDRSGDLWFGKNSAADGGIFRLGPDHHTLDFFRTAGPEDTRANTGRVLTLTVSGDTLVWFGTQGGGLGRLDPRTGDLRFYTTRDGLPHDNVEGILEDGTGMLWVTTNLGLARFDPTTEEFWVFLEGSGIQFFRFFANSAYRSEDGHLYFGGPNGITAIDPTLVVPRRSPPPVALTRFLVGGVDRRDVTNLSARSGVELAPRENFFTLEFAALDFTEPLRNRFRYRLEPFEDDWVDAGTDRSARYTGVPPGHYTFLVQARSSEGAWNREGLAIPIVVRPPLVQTIWFRGTVLALLVGILLSAYLYRRSQLARVRTMRLQIAGELHDDIGANLSAIALKSDLVRRVAPDEARSRPALADIQRLAHDTMQKVREMIWVVKEEHDTVDGLLTRMEDAAGTLLGGVVDLDFTVHQPVPNAEIGMEVRQDVYRVFKEALQNVMKHAQATAVGIDVSYRNPELRVAIVDDGTGFDPDRVQPGTGLKLMKARDQWHRAHVSVSSTPGKGTRVEIAVRIRARRRGGTVT
jgi:signal transduction histidine kinase/ligand-binding sensor domain-containing protein